MKYAVKRKRTFFKRNLALILAMMIMLSTVLVSGLSLTVFAASNISGTIYLDVSGNSDWQGKTVVASFDNGVTQTARFSGSGNMLSVTVPTAASSADKMTLTAYPSDYPFTLASGIPENTYRIITKQDKNRNYCYAWNSSDNSKNQDWPGQVMTESGNYYYIDLDKNFEKCIFNDGSDNSKTGDLTVKYIENVAYYDGAGFADSLTASVDISSLSDTQNLFVMNSNNSVSVSKYHYNGTTIDAATKTVYLYNSSWNSAYVTYDLSDVYQTTVAMTSHTNIETGVKYFKCDVPVGATIRFQSRQSSSVGGSSAIPVPTDDKTLYVMDSQNYWTTLSNLPTDSTRIPNNFADNGSNIYGVTATYFDYMSDEEITSGYLNRKSGRVDQPFDSYLNTAISNYSETNNIKKPLYFGNFYDGSHEFTSGYNWDNVPNNSNHLGGDNDDARGRAVQGLAWNTLVNNQLYVPTTSSGNAAQSPLFDASWLTDGSVNGTSKELAKVFDSYFPFVSETDETTGITTYSFDSSGGGQKSNSDNVYFTWDGTTPVAVNYGYGEEYAVSDGTGEFSVSGTGHGIFPFNSTSKTMSIPKPGGSEATITISASDVICVVDNSGWGNVWCHAWGSSDIWFEAAKKEGNNYYFHKGQFPSTVNGYQFTHIKENYDYQSVTFSEFGKKYTNSNVKNWNNSEANTDTLKIPDSYTRTGSNALDYGFGIRMDMDFRVPANGIIGGDSSTTGGSGNGKPVTFDYAGDDDLWVYISDDSGHSELVLDLGGDHKFSSGSINFNTMTSTAEKVYTNYNTDTSEQPAVPSGQLWVKKDSYSDMYLKTWNQFDEYGNNKDVYIHHNGIVSYTFKDGKTEEFYVFNVSALGDAAVFTINNQKSDELSSSVGELCTVYMNKTTASGQALQINEPSTDRASAVSYTHINSGSTSLPGKVTSTFFGGQHLDPNKTYHMTVFYMERGLIESNLQVSFTMTPVTNNLLVDKDVEIPQINNSTIRNAVYDNDTFGYTSSNESESTMNGKKYTYTDQEGNSIGMTLDDNGSFALKDQESAYFVSQFDTGSNMTVNETTVNGKNILSDRYDTSWVLYDGGNKINSGTSTSANFKLEGKDTSKNADLELAYTNTLKTGDLKITKSVRDKDGNKLDNIDVDFTYTVLLDLNGGTNYEAYPLNYTVDTNGVKNSYYTSDGTISFSPKSTVLIKDLPAGATYKITETVPDGYTCALNGQTGVISATSDASVTFTNTQSDGEGTITVSKTLDGKNYTGSQFSFELQGLESAGEGYVDASTITSENSNVENGDVTFSVKFSQVGKYRFSVKENPIDSALIGYNGDSNTYYIELDVKAGSDQNLVIDSTKYYSDVNFTTEINDITFENTTEKGKITINKQNPAGGSIDAEFAVIRVNKDSGMTADMVKTIMSDNTTKNYVVAASGKTSGGKIEFDNLPIYQDGSKIYNIDTGVIDDGENYLNGTSTTQIYCVVEYKATSGYNLNSTPYYVTFPIKASESDKLEVGYYRDSDGYVRETATHAYVFTQTFNYTNYPVVVPDASGDGMFGWIKLGLMIIAGAGVLTALYFGYNRFNRKRRMARAEAHRR